MATICAFYWLTAFSSSLSRSLARYLAHRCGCECHPAKEFVRPIKRFRSAKYDARGRKKNAQQTKLLPSSQKPYRAAAGIRPTSDAMSSMRALRARPHFSPSLWGIVEPLNAISRLIESVRRVSRSLLDESNVILKRFTMRGASEVDISIEVADFPISRSLNSRALGSQKTNKKRREKNSD